MRFIVVYYNQKELQRIDIGFPELETWFNTTWITHINSFQNWIACCELFEHFNLTETIMIIRVE